MPPTVPPIPEIPITVPISPARQMSVGNACMLEIQNAWPMVTKQMAAIASAAVGTAGARMATGIIAAPSSITNFRAFGRRHPARINLPESHPPTR